MRVHLCRHGPEGLSRLSQEASEDRRHSQRHVGPGRRQRSDHSILGDPALRLRPRPLRQILAGAGNAAARPSGGQCPDRRQELPRHRPRQPAAGGRLPLHLHGAGGAEKRRLSAGQGDGGMADRPIPLPAGGDSGPAEAGCLRPRPGRLWSGARLQHLAHPGGAGAAGQHRRGAQGGLQPRRRRPPSGQRPAAAAADAAPRPGAAAPQGRLHRQGGDLPAHRRRPHRQRAGGLCRRPRGAEPEAADGRRRPGTESLP